MIEKETKTWDETKEMIREWAFLKMYGEQEIADKVSFKFKSGVSMLLTQNKTGVFKLKVKSKGGSLLGVYVRLDPDKIVSDVDKLFMENKR